MLNEPFEKYVQNYLFWCENMRNYSPLTVQDKAYRLRQFARVAEIETLGDVTNEAIDRFILKMRKTTYRGQPIKAGTINKRLGGIMTFYRWMRDMHNIILPMKPSLIYRLKKDPEKLKVFYTREQIEMVLEHANLKESVMIRICFDSACRISELVSIRLQDIEGRVIHIVGKGNKTGRLYITKETKQMIDIYVEEFGITDYLFPSGRPSLRHQPMIKNTARMAMKKPFERAGFDNFHPHALRHSSATDYQRANAPIDEIRAFLRHSDTKTTQVYLHQFDIYGVENFDKYRKPIAIS